MKIRFLLLTTMLASLSLMAGCAVSTHYVQDGAKTYPAIQPESVQLYAADTLSVKYDVIGSIAADCVGDGDDAGKLLREEAAKIGANAVIKTRMTKISSFTSRTGLAGIAVRTF